MRANGHAKAKIAEWYRSRGKAVRTGEEMGGRGLDQVGPNWEGPKGAKLASH